jgi:hypothetical protein
MKPRVLNAAVEITRGCRLTLEWDKMIAWYSNVNNKKHKVQYLN